MLAEWLFVIAFGLCFGSFNTLLIYRLPRNKPIGFSRSACPTCKTPLGWRDLFPVASWLLSGGKCRHCHTNIHWRYPTIEFTTAILFAIIYGTYGFTVETAFISLLASFIVVICVIDLDFRIIPDSMQIVIGILGVTYSLYTGMHIADIMIGMLAGGAIGLALQLGFKYLRKKDGLGTGDVKFMAAAGTWLGISPLLPFLFYSGILGIISAMLWKLVSNDPRFPFGPALAISLLILVAYPPSQEWFMLISYEIAKILNQF